MSNGIQYINPDGLSKNPAFSQVVTTQGKGKTIYVGGQDAVNARGEIVGKGDIGEQTEQVMKNLQTALSACGATFDNLVNLPSTLFRRRICIVGFRLLKSIWATWQILLQFPVFLLRPWLTLTF